MLHCIHSGRNSYVSAIPALQFSGDRTTSFSPEGGEAYLHDLPNAEMHPLDSGHFAVKACLEEISNNIVHFYESRVDTGKGVGMTVNSVSSRFDLGMWTRSG